MRTRTIAFGSGLVAYGVGWMGAAGARGQAFDLELLILGASFILASLWLALASAVLGRRLERLAPGPGPEHVRIAARINELERALGNGREGLRAVEEALVHGDLSRLEAWARASGPTSLLSTVRQVREIDQRQREQLQALEGVFGGSTGGGSNGLLRHLREGIMSLQTTLRETRADVGQIGNALGTGQSGLQALASDFGDVQLRLTELSAGISRWEGSTQTISLLAKDVQDLAFRSDLLAINASVEVAKAGASGRGFAVLAEGMQTLSERCKAAARSTARVLDETDAVTTTSAQAAHRMLLTMARLKGNVEGVSACLDELKTRVDAVHNEVECAAEHAERTEDELNGATRDLQSLTLLETEDQHSSAPPPPPPPVPAAAFVTSVGPAVLDASGQSADGLTFDLHGHAQENN